MKKVVGKIVAYFKTLKLRSDSKTYLNGGKVETRARIVGGRGGVMKVMEGAGGWVQNGKRLD